MAMIICGRSMVHEWAFLVLRRLVVSAFATVAQRSSTRLTLNQEEKQVATNRDLIVFSLSAENFFNGGTSDGC